MIANISNSEKTASLHLPFSSFQLAGILAYLGEDHLNEYDLSCNGEKKYEIWISLEPTGIAERNIADIARKQGVSLARLNGEMSALDTIPYGQKFNVLDKIVAAVACLIVIAMVFTACMCIPEVRESMWNAVVNWYEDHVSVNFTKNDSAETDSMRNGSTADTAKEPPSRIEKRAAATYLPEGYYAEDNEISTLFTDTFYYDAEGNMRFRMMQTVLGETDQEDLMVDNENDPVTTMYINKYEGLLVEYPDAPGLYYLVWQDECYQYSLYGTFDSIDELMNIAEGVTTE